MVYCSHCGSKIDDDAYFCPRCGTKTVVGKTAKVTYPSDELKDVFYQVGTELEKAFTLAAHETHEAFKKVSQDFQKKNAPTQQATPSEGSQGGRLICRLGLQKFTNSRQQHPNFFP